MTLSLATPVFVIATIAALVVPAECIDQTIDWTFGSSDGGEKFDILQCQAVTFDWMAGGFHDVWEFDDEDAYDACDFTKAVELAPASPTGTFTISEDGTFDVTKRWFGCSIGNHCDSVNGGNMKVAVKIRPHLTQKFPGFQCQGGTVDITKTEPTLKACRKRCKRRRGCFAIEYNSSTSKCKAYKEVPSQGVKNTDATCEIARTTCEDEPAPTSAPTPAPTPEPVCSVDLRVGCKLSSDKTTECSALPNLPTPTNPNDCKVLVNYTYYVKHLAPQGALLESTTRFRKDAELGGDERAYQTAVTGLPATGSVLDTWEEDFVNLCETKKYTTTLETISNLASAGLRCVESKEYVIDVDPSAQPPSPAPPCSLDLEVTCIEGDEETDCASVQQPPADGSCTKEITYKYRVHNVGTTDANILSLQRTRPNAKFNGEVWDFSNVLSTPRELPRLFEINLSEGPYFLNFCTPKQTYKTTFEATATCDEGTTIYTAEDVYEFAVV